MEIKEIKFDDSSLVFYDENDSDVYNIAKDWLPETMSDGTSEWIHQLASKTWSTTAMLIEVADIIKNEFPDNQINWVLTNRLIAKSK